MERPTTSKFKYFLSPENTYLIDFGDVTVEILGADIMLLIWKNYLESNSEES